MSKTVRILITGGAGFIGSHLAKHLLKEGAEVVILDDLSTGSRDNIHPAAQFYHGSICDTGQVAQAVQGCTGIVHLAATVSVPECIADWAGGHRVNIGGTINVFEAARAQGNVPVIYASSAAVYGDQNETLCSENMLPAPLSPYGADKLACEHHARAFWKIYGLPSAGLRFFNVFGLGQSMCSPYAGVVARFCENAQQKITHTVYGDGLQRRDFVHVSDVTEVISKALTLLTDMPSSIVSNVCNNRSTSLMDLIEVLGKILPGSERDVSFVPARSGDIRFSRGDDFHMKDVFGEIRGRSLLNGLTEILLESRHLEVEVSRKN